MEPEPVAKDPNQVVAYNMARFREHADLSLAELAHELRLRTNNSTWSRMSVSAAERSWKLEGRRKSFDAAQILALSDIFQVPVGAWFLPPRWDEDTENVVFGPVWAFERERMRAEKYPEKKYYPEKYPDEADDLSDSMSWKWTGEQLIESTGLGGKPLSAVLVEELRKAHKRYGPSKLADDEKVGELGELASLIKALRDFTESTERRYEELEAKLHAEDNHA